MRLHVNARIDDTGAARGRFWTEAGGCPHGRPARHRQLPERGPPVGAGILAFGVDGGEGANRGGDSVLGIPIGAPLANCPPALSDGVLVEGGSFVAHDAALPGL